MILIKIDNIKTFTSSLLVKDTFNEMLLSEATICTHSTFSIDGKLNTAYYDNEEETPKNSYSSWEVLRPICFDIIKGKHLPSYFKFIFRLSNTNVSQVIAPLSDYTLTDIDGLFLNVKYDKGAINITTGTSMKTFTLDKSVEKAFDKYVCDFLEANNIEYSV